MRKGVKTYVAARCHLTVSYLATAEQPEGRDIVCVHSEGSRRSFRVPDESLDQQGSWHRPNLVLGLDIEDGKRARGRRGVVKGLFGRANQPSAIICVMLELDSKRCPERRVV